MLIVQVKESESIDKAIKRYRKKYQRTKVLKQIRANQQFIKKSIEKREQRKKAVYKQQFLNEQNEI
ncbi:30S ribosomal protein S21 [Moheibacter lacus]|uniref:Small ribosomal subunit protein bS21 n=1 Tax=Moheibacter lacus TaxID=2745851 RepID=A0A838ZSJ7_9FLAO|nr:30S ribosomal protein S21 [Moheibacter lacus]MBA5629954.1 30S ribosomal protein S21 [Moheibacter lacus]